MFERALKLVLLLITCVNSISISHDDIALMADMLPKAAVIKLAGVGLSSGVVNVLHINKNSNFFQSRSLVNSICTNDNTFKTLNYLLIVDQLV